MKGSINPDIPFFEGDERHRTSSGIIALDQVLQGGFQSNSLVHIFGEPGSGKTAFAMTVAAQSLRRGRGVVWVDCNGAFSINRLRGLIERQDLDNLTLVKTTSLSQQARVIQLLQLYLENVTVIVVDPITHHYRAERYSEGSQGFFQVLVEQLATLAGYSHLQKILVLVVNYATHKREQVLVPLAAQAFRRVEKYRLCFRNSGVDEGAEDWLGKEMTMELAPEKYAQGCVVRFGIAEDGLRGSHLDSRIGKAS